jgi:hypothetical protein
MYTLRHRIIIGSLSVSLIFNNFSFATTLGAKPTVPQQDGSEGITTPIMEYPVSAQYPAQFFVDGKIPQMLVDFRSQQYLLQQHKEEIIKRSKEDEGKPLVTIGVLDIGADLENKALREHIKFDIKDGKIVGAGYDHMSQTPWGTHQLLDPWIYAIGAESVNEFGQIKLQDTQSPIKHLLNLNSLVVDQVLLEIKNNPQLQNTFFSKLNKKNINMIGILKLAQIPVSLEEYEQNLKNGEIYKLNSQNTEKAPGLVKSFINNPELQWVMNPSTGLPDGLELLADKISQLQGADEFMKIISGVLQTKEIITPLKKEIGNLNKFFQIHHFATGSQVAEIFPYTMVKMSNLIALQQLGSQIESPLFDYFMLLRRLKLENPSLKWDVLLDNSFKIYEALLQSYHQDNVNKKEYSLIDETEKYLSDLDYLKKFVYELDKESKLDVVFDQFMNEGKVPWIKGFSSSNRKMLVRGLNPVLHPESQYADHGSHVAGTSKAYFKDYRVFPIRVSLGMVKANPIIQDEFVNKNMQALQSWLELPIVSRSIMNTFKKDAKISGDILNYDLNSENGRKAFVKFLMTDYFNNYLRVGASRGGIVGQSLLWEIRESAKMLADRKIPFANLSLGGEVEQPDYDKYQDRNEEKIKATLDYIYAEFEKYHIAEALSTVGKNTLYMMAAGNSKNYADNESRTDYPAGLSSPWLAKNRKQGETLPTDGMKNVAVVMSLNETNSLSNYTNLILSGDEVIAIRGEDILSQTTSHSQWSVKKTFRRVLPEVRLFDFNPEDNRFVNFLKKTNMPESLVKVSIKMAKSFVQVSKLFLFHKYNDKMDLKDGTSMATPTAVAMAAEIFQKRLARLSKKLGRVVTEAEIYGKAGFTPEDIMEVVKKNIRAEKYGPSVTIKKIKNAKNQEPSQKENEFTKKLLQIRNSGALCLKYYK